MARNPQALITSYESYGGWTSDSPLDIGATGYDPFNLTRDSLLDQPPQVCKTPVRNGRSKSHPSVSFSAVASSRRVFCGWITRSSHPLAAP